MPISPKTWIQDEYIYSFYFEAASGGDGTLSYTASGLPGGVTMFSSRFVFGSPTSTGTGTATVTATDGDGDTATKSFDWTVVSSTDRVPRFGTTAIAAKTWKQGQAIASFNFEAAFDGDAPLSYAAANLPAGVTMSSSRRISGTPAAAGSGMATVTVTDADGDSNSKSFQWTVEPDLTPAFSSAAIAPKTWSENQIIPSFTFEAATGGDAPLTYTASGLPDGVTMYSTRWTYGRPTAAGSGTATVTVTDSDGDTDTKSFEWTVVSSSDRVPKFYSTTIAPKTWNEGQSIAPFYFEAAHDGDTPLSYSASGLPAGVTMSSSRRISGTPTAAGTGTATVTVTDADGDSNSKSFQWTVEPNRVPSFSDTAIEGKSWTRNQYITAFYFEAATGGDGALAYTASGLPAGVTMFSSRYIRGTPTSTGSGTATVTATDSDGDTATKSFEWTVTGSGGDRAPRFPATPIAARTWTVNQAIATFDVEAATDGDPPLSYTARGLPSGVTMSSARRISGTPTAADSGTATVTVTDSDGDTDTKTFTWTVLADGSGGNGTSTNPHILSDPLRVSDMDIFGLLRGYGHGDNASSATYFQFTAPGGQAGTWAVATDGTPNSGADWDLKGDGGLSGVNMNADESDTVTLAAGQAYNFRIYPYDSSARYALTGLTLTLTPPNDEPGPGPDFGGASVGAKSWVANEAIAGFTVPAATGGDGALTYSAVGLPTGVTMSGARFVSGTPTGAGSGTATVTVSDEDGDTDTLSFTWTVISASEETGTGTQADPYILPDPTRVSGKNIFGRLRGSGHGNNASAATYFRFTVPDGQTGTWTIAIDGMPNSGADWDLNGDGGLSGVNMNADESDTVTLAAGQVYNFRVYPYSAGARSALSGLRLTLTPPNEPPEDTPDPIPPADRVPDFGTATVPAKTWVEDRAIAAFTVPAATGGDGALTYSAVGLPTGVTMSSARLVSGTPTRAGSGTATVTARDEDGDTDALSFTWSVTSASEETGAGTQADPYILPDPARVSGQNIFGWLRGSGHGSHNTSAATYFRFTVPDGQDGVWTVAIDGAPNSGADWDLKGDAGLSSIRTNADESDTVYLTAGRVYNFRVYPYSAGARSALSGLALTLTPPNEPPEDAPVPVPPVDRVPDFGTASVPDQSWTANRAITAFTVPAAAGGDAPLTYTATGLPAGVAMSSSRLISGTPAAEGTGTATITVTDADGDTDTLSVVWTVAAPLSPHGLRADPNPSTDGSYTVFGSMDTFGPPNYTMSRVVETGPDGQRREYSVSDPDNISLSFSGKTEGTYVYHTQKCAVGSDPDFRRLDCIDSLLSLSVIVDLPETAPPPPGRPTGPDTNTDGAYTITWSGVAGATRYELRQSRNGGSWTDVSPAGTATSKGFTDQTSGEYHYRVRACSAAGCGDWSAIKMVWVSRPPTVGFDSTYVSRTGVLSRDDDNDTDIYLSPLAVGTGNVGEFILRNDAGTFTLVTNPTNAELAEAQSWLESTQLEIVLEDANVDGVWDAFVAGISGASGFGGAVDQIVVSPRTAGATPTGLIAVDSDVKSFFNSVMAWYENLDHFNTTVSDITWVIDGVTDIEEDFNSYRRDCIEEWGSCFVRDGTLTSYYGSTVACVMALASAGLSFTDEQGNRISLADGCGRYARAWFGRVQGEITIKDFSSVSEGAIDRVAEFIRIWEAGETQYEVEDLADVLEDMLGVRIGGLFDDRLDEVQRGLFNLYALFGAEGRRNVDIPANSVIVTKRRVRRFEWAIHRLNFHAALELPLAETYGVLGYNPTIAAYEDSDMLVSVRNDASERNNLFAGTVTFGPANFFSVWTALAESDRKYCNNLDYAYPFLQKGPNHYNSNSYASGIIRSIGASTNAPIHTFYYGHIPVPPSEFEDRDCTQL